MAIPELTTDRLLLRPFVLGDAATVQELVSAREVAATIDGMPHPYPEGAAETWIGSHAADVEAGAGYTWAITRRHDATLTGAVALHVVAWHQRGVIGY